MNYQALYRKYRPINFSQVVGQDDVVTILKNSISNKSFVHAYLFSGPKGTGKTSVARILAKTINCLKQEAGEACNRCSNCKIINDGKGEIDILEIDGASNNSVEEIRNIRNNINLLPMNLKFKIYIIDEVHMLSTAAFNALLKTLEEPPEHIIFIFATTEAYKIPETVISRCQWFWFEKINHKALTDTFSKILTAENISFESEALKELALIADGSLRDGINNLEKVFNFSNDLTLKNVYQIFNIISLKKKLDFLQAILEHNLTETMFIINEVNNYFSDFKKLIAEMLSLIQDLIIYGWTKNIKTTRQLTLAQITIFAHVEAKDLKIILNLFESVIILNLDNSSLKILLISRILKLFDHLKQYSFSDQLAEPKVIKQETIVKSESAKINNEELKEDKSQEIKFGEEEEKIEQELLDNVLNVIVQADKELRKELKEYWTKIHQLIESNKFHNFSKIYLNTVISAACTNGVIIICDNIIQADLINKNFYHQEYRNFLNFVLTKEYMVYALDKKQWKAVARQYSLLVKNKQLPKAKPILIPEVTIKKSEDNKSQTLAFLQNIFSEIEEI